MSTQRYSVTPQPINVLLAWVRSGEIATPEIQRPFVWEPTKVRNLLDSLYALVPHAMIADLKPYPEYKESGLPWLESIPSHWQTNRNGNLFGQRNDVNFPDLPILEVSLRTGVRVRGCQINQ